MLKFCDFLKQLEETQPDAAFPAGPASPRHIVFSPEGACCVVRAEDGRWSMVAASGTQAGSFVLPEPAIRAQSAAFSHDGLWLMMLTHTGNVMLQHLAAADDTFPSVLMEMPPLTATACCFVGGGMDIAVGFSDGVVTVDNSLSVQAPNEPATRVLYQHPSAVGFLQAAADGSFVMTSDAAGGVVVFDRTLTPESRRGHGLHAAPLVACAFSPSGEYLVTADSEGVVLLAHLCKDPTKAWSKTGVSAHNALTVLDVPTLKGERVSQISFSPMGRWLAVTYEGLGLVLHKFELGRNDGPFAPEPVGFSGPLRGTTLFSADEKYLLTLGDSASAIFETENVSNDTWVPLPRGIDAAALIPGEANVVLASKQGAWMSIPFVRLFAAGAKAKTPPSL